MVTKLKPYNPSASELVSDWHVMDARGKVLGRLATEAAMLLMGKHRPEYVPHMISGDFVIVTNAAEVTVTGNKENQIVYRRHSQKPGKLKEIPYKKVRAAFPERIIEHAVRGMLPKNKLGERMIRRLKVYAGEEHPHVSQIAWSAGRPERDVIAAEKAEEEAKKRTENRLNTVARREIAASAAARSATPEPETAEPKSGRRPASAKAVDVPEQAVAVAPVESEVADTVTTEDAAPLVKEPAATSASTSKASAAKSPGTAAAAPKKSGSGPSRAPASKTPAAKSGATISRKTPTARKSPAAKKPDDK